MRQVLYVLGFLCGVILYIVGAIAGIAIAIFGGKMVLAKPIRPAQKALRYLLPRRLTLAGNPRVHAWLWWNF